MFENICTPSERLGQYGTHKLHTVANVLNDNLVYRFVKDQKSGGDYLVRQIAQRRTVIMSGNVEMY